MLFPLLCCLARLSSPALSFPAVTPRKVCPEYYANAADETKPDRLVKVFLFLRGRWDSKANDTDSDDSDSGSERSVS